MDECFLVCGSRKSLFLSACSPTPFISFPPISFHPPYSRGRYMLLILLLISSISNLFSGIIPTTPFGLGCEQFPHLVFLQECLL